MKLATIIGARPQFIKASAVSAALRETNGDIAETVIHTGQHYDRCMSDIFFSELEMAPPDYDLGIGSGTHGQQTGKMLAEIEHILTREQPDCVLLYGDTNSTLAGALAASKLCIPIAHVEAGLRSFNRRMPEEINRVLTDHLSDLLFAPTAVACRNLEFEGVPRQTVHLVGDVMFDVALRVAAKSAAHEGILQRLGLKPGAFVLCTVHRAENTNDTARLIAILQAMSEVSHDLPVVFPVHPRTRKVLNDPSLSCRIAPGVRLIEPLGYLDMAALEKNAALIATDSGGVQKEAFFHRVPCVTLRDETEWVELIEAGWNRLAPPSRAADIGAIIRRAIGIRGRDIALYGDGHAARRIVQILTQQLSPCAQPEMAGLVP